MKSFVLLLILIFSANLNAQSFNFKKKSNKYIFKNENGKLDKTKQFDEALFDDDGMWIVRNDTKWGLLSYKGEIVSEVKYDEIKSFKTGVAIVSFDNKFGVINKKGEIVLDLIYDKVDYYSEAESLVKKEGNWGFITDGEFTKTTEEFILSNPDQEALMPQCLNQPDNCNERAMLTKVYRDIKYPPLARKKGVQGIVVAEVVIDKNGKLNSCQIIEPAHYLLDAETERVISENLREWIPAIDNGKAVASKKRIPIKYKLH